MKKSQQLRSRKDAARRVRRIRRKRMWRRYLFINLCSFRREFEILTRRRGGTTIPLQALARYWGISNELQRTLGLSTRGITTGQVSVRLNKLIAQHR